MNSTQEDAVLNFDLDFLHPATNNIPVPAPKLKYITQLKRRIIRVDALQSHSNAINQELVNKNKELEESKRKLESTTQEYRQTSLDYKEALETSTRCERENTKLKATITKLEEERFKAVNDYEAIKSHVAQLEELVKQQERKLESQDKIDKKKTDKVIEEKIIAKIKDNEKEISLWKKKYESLQKEFYDLKCLYNKLNKEVLQQQHEKVSSKIANDSMSHDLSENEDDMSVNVTSTVGNQDSTQNDVDLTQKCPTGKDNTHMELDNDCINEVVCVDLGYGSSLASSDNEKWLNSPDYVFSPINGDNIEVQQMRKLLNTATSPIQFLKMTERATSPIQFLKMTERATSPILSVKMIDVAVSPVDNISHTNSILTEDKACSPSQSNSILTEDKACSPINLKISPVNNAVTEITVTSVESEESQSDTNGQKITIDKQLVNSNADKAVEKMVHIDIIQEKQEKQCLELNNSDNMDDDCSADNEIEMILNKMRFNHNLITPLPRTPGKTYSQSASSNNYDGQSTTDSTHSKCVDAAIARAHAITAKEEAASAREYAAKTREDNKELKATLNKLMNEMLNIKTFLKNQMSMPDSLFQTNQDYPSKNANTDNSLNNSCDTSINKVNSEPLNTKNNCIPPNKKITIISDEIIKPRDTDIFFKTQAEGRLFINTSQQMEVENSAEQNISSEIEDVSINNEVVKMKSPTKDIIDRKGKKKLTNLGKYRKKCELRKYKIRSETPPLVKPLKKPKQMRLIKHVTECDNSATLNDSQVYANAVKVMAQLNAKTKVKCSKEPQSDVDMQHEIDARKEHNKDTDLCNETTEAAVTVLKSDVIKTSAILPETMSAKPKLPVLLKEPMVILPRYSIKSLEKIINLTIPTLCKQSIKSPEFPVALCDNTITPSKCSIKSPDIATLYTKTTSNHSEQATISPLIETTNPLDNSRNPLITSPRQCIMSPDFHVALESAESPSQYSGVNSEIADASINLVATSPGQPLMSPDLPDRLVKSASSPMKVAATSPLPFIKPMFTYSKHFVKSSEVSYIHHPTHSPEALLTSTSHSINAEVASRMTAISTPNQIITSPRLTKNSSILNNVALKASGNTLTKPDDIPSSLTNSSSVNADISTKLAGMSSRVTRSRSKQENDLSDGCFVALQRDSIIRNMPHNRRTTVHNSIKENECESEQPFAPINRKRTHSNTSDTLSKKISRRKLLMDTEEKSMKTDVAKISSGITIDDGLSTWHSKESMLCTMIQKYCVKNMKQCNRSLPGLKLDYISATIEKYILKMKKVKCNESKIMNELVAELKTYDHKILVPGIMHYLTKLERRDELCSKSSLLPAPPMTKSEQILLYVLRQIRYHWSSTDIVKTLLSSIEYTMFRLTKTPEFEVIESVSHFYALICRYFELKNHLIVFMLDAMYCIQFKSVSLIKQCLDVWPQVIPLAHMSIAKTPLVTCFIYLLHFYKCDDRYNRLAEIRNILHRQYFYRFTDWNQDKILDIFQSAITELKDVPLEKTMLRIALIILGKRHGARWTQTNIIKKILQPLVNNDSVANNKKAFCISLIGPLMKPYPIDMKANCEVAMNQLMNIKKTTTCREIEEAVITSLVLMSRHSERRVNEILLKQKMWPISNELEDLLCSYVKMKPKHIWLKALPRLLYSSDNDCK